MTRPIPKLAGVCGWPIHQSLSPQLHSYWLRAMGVPGAYVPFLVREDRAVEAFRSLLKTSIVGVNVTAPLKGHALAAADEVSPVARRLGAANVLYKRGLKLVAHNTDEDGFSAPLLGMMSAAELSRSTAVVVGAGGAARAVVGALVSLGLPEIRITSRRDAAAQALSDTYALPSVHMMPWARRAESLRGAALVVNASAGGMAGKAELDLDLSRAQPGAVAYDLVYNPAQTGFLRAAEAQGMRTLGGLSMLVAQARPSFELFFGERPPESLDPSPMLRRLLGQA